MTKLKLLIIFSLIFFFCLNTVAAVENETFHNDIGLLSDNSDIIVKNKESIQKAIDNASPGSTIIVEKGTYSEDIIIDKDIIIKGNDATLNSKNTAFFIKRSANNTLISGFNINVANNNGVGILINGSNCKITDNTIAGGNIGILADMIIENKSGTLNFDLVGNIEVLRNTLTGQHEAGIFIKAFNPTVSKNKVTNVVNRKENGTAYGILAQGMGIDPSDLNVVVTNNYVSNIKSLTDSAYGIDIAGNSVFDTLKKFKTENNVAKIIEGAVNSYGINIGVFSLNTTLPTIKITNLKINNIKSTKENGSAVGLGVSVTTIGQNDTTNTIINNIVVKNIKTAANGKANGIDVTGVGCVDLYVKNNFINNIKATKSAKGISATGIEYTNFKAFIDVSNNNITNINSPSSNGVYLMSLGDGKITNNIMYNIPGKGTTFITGITLSISTDNANMSIPQNATIDEIIDFIKNLSNNLDSLSIDVNGDLTVTGNNIEGTGSETGFAVIRPSQIHYNRAVNLKFNVIKDSTRRFILESYDYDPKMSNEELAYLLLKSQEAFENCTEEELRNMSISMGAFLDKFFGNLDESTAGNVNAKYNWWGSNSKPAKSKFKNNNGKIIYNPWLTLRIRANPRIIDLNQYSKVTVDTYIDSNGKDHSSKSKLYFSGPKVKLTTDLGTFNGKKSITLNWTNGKAVAYLKGDRYGLANITASDGESVNTTVLITHKNQTIKEYGAKETIKMLPAGNPLGLIIIALLLSFVALYQKNKLK